MVLILKPKLVGICGEEDILEDEVVSSNAIEDAKCAFPVPVSLQGARVEAEEQAVGVGVSVGLSLSAAAA